MYMKDYIENIDSLLNTMKRPILKGSGKVSHEEAVQKVEREYKKYQVENLSDIEKEYLKSIQLIEKKAKKKRNKFICKKNLKL